jgi:hypothetical protein
MGASAACGSRGKARAERAELDRRANTVARGLLTPLAADQRTKLVAAMGEVERLLSAALVTVAVEDAATPDAQWCIGQYFAELDERFETGFDPTRGISAYAPELTRPAGFLLVARIRGRAIGCVGAKLHGRAPAEMKRMWVAREARRPRRGPSAPGRGRRSRARRRRHGHASRNERDAEGGDRAVPAERLRGSGAVQPRALRTSLV